MKIILIASFTLFFIILPEQVFAVTNSTNNSIDHFESIFKLSLTAIGASGILGLFWGIYQYKEARNDKRKETFFSLTKEFDASEQLYYAKKILDGWALDYSKEKKILFIVSSGPFSSLTIEWILSKGFRHRLEFEQDHVDYFKDLNPEQRHESWKQLRDSFDSLFDFFERLTYLYNNGRITEKELAYFAYYIDKAKTNDYVLNFLKTYQYTWYKKLV